MFGHDNTQNNQDDTTIKTTLPVDEGMTSTPSPIPSSPSDSMSSDDSMTDVPMNDDSSNTPSMHPPTDTQPQPENADSGLLSIKQQALEQLTPLVNHLDQSPEEKFRTTMMMIQGSDNQSLIKDAYAAAQQITDDKARAQALLDIVNEINYFTQHPAS